MAEIPSIGETVKVVIDVGRRTQATITHVDGDYLTGTIVSDDADIAGREARFVHDIFAGIWEVKAQ